MMARHIWLIEDRYSPKGKEEWYPAGDKNGEFRIFPTRKSAVDIIKNRNVYYGNPKCLRVRKYIREKK